MGELPPGERLEPVVGVRRGVSCVATLRERPNQMAFGRKSGCKGTSMKGNSKTLRIVIGIVIMLAGFYLQWASSPEECPCPFGTIGEADGGKL